MAPSPSPTSRDARTRLIRELSRDLQQSRSRQGSQSPRASPEPAENSTRSTGKMSSISDLSIDENEALMSTRQLDDASTIPLPNLRSSAARYAYYRPPEPEQRIDTSVVNREFGDFDQGSFHAEDDSISIELGRGFRKSTRDTENKENHSPIFKMGNNSLYDGLSTTPRTQRVTPRKSEQDSLRRNAQLRQAQFASRNPGVATGSPMSKTVNAKNAHKAQSVSRLRDALAQTRGVGANIEDIPTTVPMNVKNTRFSSNKARQTGMGEDMPNSGPQANQDFDPARRVPNTPPKQGLGTPRAGSAHVTQQSFMLPDLPNLTELMSGNLKDGTPVFSRSTRARSRLVNGQSAEHPDASRVHAPVESVPVPEEEKVIYAALQQLQDKIEELEGEKLVADRNLDNYENDLAILRAQLDAQENYHDKQLNGLGEAGTKSDWRVETETLKFIQTTLQDKLDRAHRKLLNSDSKVNRLTQERDDLVAQLRVAFYNVEELKIEKEALQEENEGLRKAINRSHPSKSIDTSSKAGLAQSSADRQNRSEGRARQVGQTEIAAEAESLKAQLSAAEASHKNEARKWKLKEKELRDRLETRDNTIQKFRDMTGELGVTSSQNDNAALKHKLAKVKAQHQNDVRQWSKTEDRLREQIGEKEGANLVKGYGVQRARNSDVPVGRSVSVANAIHSRAGHAEQLQSRRVSAPVTTQSIALSDSEVESTTNLRPRDRKRQSAASLNSKPNDAALAQAQDDITFLSLMDDGKIAGLRKMLEEERIAARKARKSGVNNTAASAAIPRKSSLKNVEQPLLDLVQDELTARTRVTSRAGSEAEVCLTSRDWANIAAAQQAKGISAAEDQSFHSMASSARRRRSAPTEMTSAFILPDITVRVPANANDTFNGLDDDNKENRACPHRAKNCTVCVAESIAIPTPIPVSDRTNMHEADVTMRPVHAPNTALAMVLKELQDELVHLKRDLALEDEALQAQDPSLGRRQRKAIQERIAKLLKAIDRRSDQIYKLYDVVEGQKQDAVPNVEDTLRSVGIDPDELTTTTRDSFRNGGRRRRSVVVQSADESTASEAALTEEDVPWSGFSESRSVSLRRQLADLL